MAQRDICIKFEVEGEPFEAVGVLNEGEGSVLGDTILERVPDAIGEKDWAFLCERTSKFPAELRQYYLVTARRSPVDPCYISYFCWLDDGDRWYQGWYNPDYQRYGNDLVLRRGKKATPGTEAT